MEYSQWEAMIVNRMNQPAPVTIHLDGEYSPGSNTGTIYATFRNDSSATIIGRVIFVMTEDSLFFPAANGVMWHCNVPRDYIPNDTGVVVTITPGDSVSITMPFTTHPDWNKVHCKIKTWIQNDQILPDSTKEIWQGAIVRLLELSILENQGEKREGLDIQIAPNPCLRNTMVYFSLPHQDNYEIHILDCTGKRINKLSGNGKRLKWDLKDAAGNQLCPGVYLYRLASKKFNATGKIIIE